MEENWGKEGPSESGYSRAILAARQRLMRGVCNERSPGACAVLQKEHGCVCYSLGASATFHGGCQGAHAGTAKQKCASYADERSKARLGCASQKGEEG